MNEFKPYSPYSYVGKKFLYLYISGGDKYDYRPEMSAALQQANLPKSGLAQQTNSYLQNLSGNVFSQLLNAQNIGNSFSGTRGDGSNNNYSFPLGGGGANVNTTPSNSATLPTANYNQSTTGPASLANYLATLGGTAINTANPFDAARFLAGHNNTGESPGPVMPTNMPQPMSFEQFSSSQGGTPEEYQQLQDAYNNTYLPHFNSLINAAANGNSVAIEQLGGTGALWPNFASQVSNTTPQQMAGGWNNTGNPYGDPTLGQGAPVYLQGGQYTNDLQQALALMSQGATGSSANGIPGFSSANPQLSPLALQNQNPQALQTLLSRLQGPGLSNYNPAASMLGSGQFQGQIGQANLQGISGLSDAIQRSLSGASSNSPLQSANPNAVNAPNAQLNLPQNVDVTQTAMDSPYYQAVQSLLANKQQQDINDLRARFGASGGTSRGTPAAFAEAQLRSQQAPEIAAALGGIRQQEIANALSGQQNNISGAQVGNNSLLQARQQDIGNAQQNVQNLLQAAGINNSANLQSQGLQNDLLGTLFGQFNNQQGNTLQNYYNSVNAGLTQGGLLNQLTSQAAGQNLGLQQLGSQNYLGTAGLNSQNANSVLGNQNSYLNTILGAQNQNNNLLSQLAQFNAGQANNYGLTLQGQQQAANEAQIGRQFTGYQNLLSGILALAGAGTPGGSANVNLNAAPVGGYNPFTNTLQALSGFF